MINKNVLALSSLLNKIPEAKFYENNDSYVLEMNGRKFDFNPGIPCFYEDGDENKFFNFKTLFKELNIIFSPEDKANSGLKILEPEDILKLKVGLTLEQCSEYRSLQSRYGDGLLDKIYPNINKYTIEEFEDKNLAFDKEFCIFKSKIYRKIFNDETFVNQRKNIEINIVEDLSKLALEYIRLQNNGDSILELYSSLNSFNSYDGNYDALVKDFPDMKWLPKWLEKNGEYNDSFHDYEIDKLIKEIIKFNPAFLAYLKNDIMQQGDFYFEKDLVKYIINKHMEEFKSLKTVAEIHDLVINEVENIDPEYLIPRIREIIKSNNLVLEERLIKYIASYIINNYNQKDKAFNSLHKRDVWDAIVNLFENNFKKLYDYDEKLFETIVRSYPYNRINKETALLMSKDYQNEWEIENGVILDEDLYLSPMEFNDIIEFIVTSTWQERS